MDAPTDKKLFLLDGMALAYRGHFALINRPIFTAQGFNTSALYVYTNTLVDLIQKHQPTHLGVAFDTSAPTQRHTLFPQYKAQRDEMPEELSQAMPYIRRITEAFNIPVLIADGYEADDLIGTLACQAADHGFTTYMVTPDKDFSQLVGPRTFLYKPSRMGDGVEILGVPEVCAKWKVQDVRQVIDILGLWGDASDNIPGVPGVGEKTAQKLIADYGSIQNLLDHTHELKGKLKERLESHREQALLSKKLATIDCHSPIPVSLEHLKWAEPSSEALKALFTELEFNSIGRRLFGDEFSAGRGFHSSTASPTSPSANSRQGSFDLDLKEPEPAPARAPQKTLADVPHHYQIVQTDPDRQALLAQLAEQKAFAFDLETSALDPRAAQICGIALSWEAGRGYYLALPQDDAQTARILDQFRPILENPETEKAGHNLKFDLAVLRWHGVRVGGPLFDTMIAHALVEPDLRHSLDYVAESLLGYTPVPIEKLIGTKKDGQISMRDVPLEQVAEYAVEDADLAWQLRSLFKPLLVEKGQERVFYKIECPLVPVLVEMEVAGICLDKQALAEVAKELTAALQQCEQEVHELAGATFNLSSPRQLGEILFDRLKLGDKPKKTRTGQYATNEQTLLTLASRHPIVRRLLDYRECSKLKNTYVDLLPEAIWPASGRVHTTFSQVVTATGRLASQNPNLQNIPIRTEQGRTIRKAFIPGSKEHLLLSADYSQIELRIIAALSQDDGLLDAFQSGTDIHTATAARVYGVDLGNVSSEMRRNAKMVNFGIIYGISAFGLSQRLAIPRHEAAAIIDQYFKQYPGVQRYLRDTIEFARQHGYVQTVTGRRRYIRDIRSANATLRNAAERNAINAPVQGTAADMIKIAMIDIHHALRRQNLKTRMLLQVHDELVFDLLQSERNQVLPIVEEKMKNAIELPVPIVVELGTGANWLEAH